MLYYITPMEFKLYTSSKNQKSWFAASIENEHYVVRFIQKKYHVWDVGSGELCLCCNEAKWNFQVDWDEAT